MKNLTIVSIAGVLLACFMATSNPVVAAELWHLGTRDGGSLEFGKKGEEGVPDTFLAEFPEPVVVRAEDATAVNQWPKFQPGPADAWAESKSHTYTILFDVPDAAVLKDAKSVELLLSLSGHPVGPPTLSVALNGVTRTFTLRADAGGDRHALLSLASNGNARDYTVSFPVNVLKAKDNRLTLTTTEKSWLIYDAISMHTSAFVPTDHIAVGEAFRGKRNEIRKFILVFKTHVDIGYTHMAAEVVNAYRTSMIDRALAVVEQNKQLPKNEQFVWTIPGWLMKEMLWEGQTPERREAIEAAVRNGNLVVHGLPFTMHTETLGLEDLVRGLEYGSDFARHFGFPLPADGKMTDVPSHTWYLETLAAHSGINFLCFGCNGSSTPVKVPMLYWWEGPDGSRTLTMYFKQYGGTVLPPADWRYPVWISLLHTHDNHGPPRPAEVQNAIAAIKNAYPDAEIQIGKMSDFYDAMMADPDAEKFLPEIPVVRADMPDTWIHGPMCNPVGSRLAHTLRPAIAAAENLDTLQRIWGLEPETTAVEAEKFFTDVYEQSIMYGEHTWGWNIATSLPQMHGKAWDELLAAGLTGNFRKSDESWQEHDDYIRYVEKHLPPYYEKSLRMLASRVSPETPYVVYNPLPWTRSQLLRTPDGMLDAKNVPGGGYKTFSKTSLVRPAGDFQIDETRHRVQTPFYTVTLDLKNSCIGSIIEKETGRELVEQDAPFGFGQYVYQRASREEIFDYVRKYVRPDRMGLAHAHVKTGIPAGFEHLDIVSQNATVEYAEKDGQLTVTLVSALGPKFDDHQRTVRLEITLYEDEKPIDLDYTYEKRADDWAEADWISLPLAVEKPDFKLGRLGSISDMKRDLIEKSNYDMLWLNTGLAAIDEAGRGIGVCPIDSPLVSVGVPGAYRFAAKYEPRPARIYVNLFNNIWHTNFRNWWGGTLKSRVRVWPIAKYDAESSLITPAMEARVPMTVAVRTADMEAPKAAIPAQANGVALSRKGILCTAFYASAQQGGTVMRLWEIAGNDGPCTITLPAGMKATTAQPTDLRGVPVGEAIPVENGRVTIPVPHFAPVTLLLR